MAEYIKQKIERGKKSICDSCFHQNVCKGIGNQPCTKCSHYQDAADVSPVVPGRWISLTECANEGVYCSICKKKVWKSDYAWCSKKSRNKLRSNYCPNCGARMDGDGNG